MSRSIKKSNQPQRINCVIYTRKSSQEGLEQSFNSLDAQREACASYIKSQQHEGWALVPTIFDDGGFSGGNMERPALKRLIEAIKSEDIKIIVVYKVDRLSRSLADFVRIVDLLDKHGVSFVSVTQHFNTSSSMGRLTLNVLLSFAQFEREVTGERIRDKIAASKQKGMWMGGVVPLGYDVIDKQLVVNAKEARLVNLIFIRYLDLGCVRKLKAELDKKGCKSKSRLKQGVLNTGKLFSRGALYGILKNPLYNGKVAHGDKEHEGKHDSIVEVDRWKLVQQNLLNNRISQLRQNDAKEPSLLSGLIFDDNGNSMSPTHTAKKHKRYRYYISQALLQFKEKEAGSVSRLSAITIEELVFNHVKHLLTSEGELRTKLNVKSQSATIQKRFLSNALKLSRAIATMSLHDKISLAQKVIVRVTVSLTVITIIYSSDGLLEILLSGHLQSGQGKSAALKDVVYSLPAKLKRCGIETRLVVQNDKDSRANIKTIRAIQCAVRKALIWNQALIDGKAESLSELARENNVTQRYVANIIKLAYLSPQIMEKLVKGNIPVSLSLDILKKGVPLSWLVQNSSLRLC